VSSVHGWRRPERQWPFTTPATASRPNGAAAIANDGGRAATLAADLRERYTPMQLADAVEAELGPVDIVEVEETRDLGDVIMLVVQQSGQGSASGVPIPQPFTWVMRFDKRLLCSMAHLRRAWRALEDAGLSE
jgi:hypothetical protein